MKYDIIMIEKLKKYLTDSYNSNNDKNKNKLKEILREKALDFIYKPELKYYKVKDFINFCQKKFNIEFNQTEQNNIRKEWRMKRKNAREERKMCTLLEKIDREIKDEDEFKELIKSLKNSKSDNVYFRGHTDINWDIIPSCMRDPAFENIREKIKEKINSMEIDNNEIKYLSYFITIVYLEQLFVEKILNHKDTKNLPAVINKDIFKDILSYDSDKYFAINDPDFWILIYENLNSIFEYHSESMPNLLGNILKYISPISRHYGMPSLFIEFTKDPIIAIKHALNIGNRKNIDKIALFKITRYKYKERNDWIYGEPENYLKKVHTSFLTSKNQRIQGAENFIINFPNDFRKGKKYPIVGKNVCGIKQIIKYIIPINIIPYKPNEEELYSSENKHFFKIIQGIFKNLKNKKSI